MPVIPIGRFARRLTVVTLTVAAAAHAASASAGAFTLRLPGAAGAAGGGGTGAKAGTPAGGLTLTSADGSPPSGEQLDALAVSDGTLNGGQGVSFPFAGDGSTQLVGTLAFNLATLPSSAPPRRATLLPLPGHFIATRHCP